jgi:hypothetical protein
MAKETKVNIKNLRAEKILAGLFFVQNDHHTTHQRNIYELFSFSSNTDGSIHKIIFPSFFLSRPTLMDPSIHKIIFMSFFLCHPTLMDPSPK